jgi:hypothetical protein
MTLDPPRPSRQFTLALAPAASAVKAAVRSFLALVNKLASLPPAPAGPDESTAHITPDTSNFVNPE